MHLEALEKEYMSIYAQRNLYNLIYTRLMRGRINITKSLVGLGGIKNYEES